MSDLESFSPSESSEGVDSGALDRLREQMKEAAAGMARDQKQEQKQKKSEDALYNVLVTFINQLGPTHPLVKYIVKGLGTNILSEILLIIISLNYPTLQKLLGLELVDEDTAIATSNSIAIPDLTDSEMPLYLKINIESWIKFLNDKIFLQPDRNLASLKNKSNPEIANIAFTDLTSYIIQEYLHQSKVQFNGPAIDKFAKALCLNTVSRLEQHINSTKNLNAQNDSPNPTD